MVSDHRPVHTTALGFSENEVIALRTGRRAIRGAHDILEKACRCANCWTLDERTRCSSVSWPESVPSWNLFNVVLPSSAKCGSIALAHLLNQCRPANTAWGQG